MSFANTSVRIVGSVGDDEYANVLREACVEAGLETDFEVSSCRVGVVTRWW